MERSISLKELCDQARAAAEKDLDSAKPGEEAATLREAFEQNLGKEAAREAALEILIKKHADRILQETVGFSLEDVAKALPQGPTFH